MQIHNALLHVVLCVVKFKHTKDVNVFTSCSKYIDDESKRIRLFIFKLWITYLNFTLNIGYGTYGSVSKQVALVIILLNAKPRSISSEL